MLGLIPARCYFVLFKPNYKQERGEKTPTLTSMRTTSQRFCQFLAGERVLFIINQAHSRFLSPRLPTLSATRSLAHSHERSKENNSAIDAFYSKKKRSAKIQMSLSHSKSMGKGVWALNGPWNCNSIWSLCKICFKAWGLSWGLSSN